MNAWKQAWDIKYANVSELTATWGWTVNGIIELKEVHGVICGSKYRERWRKKYCYLCEPRIQKAVAVSLVVVWKFFEGLEDSHPGLRRRRGSGVKDYGERNQRVFKGEQT